MASYSERITPAWTGGNIVPTIGCHAESLGSRAPMNVTEGSAEQLSSCQEAPRRWPAMLIVSQPNGRWPLRRIERSGARGGRPAHLYDHRYISTPRHLSRLSSGWSSSGILLESADVASRQCSSGGFPHAEHNRPFRGKCIPRYCRTDPSCALLRTA